ncbi:PREDICTED: cyclin-J18-like isoform X2 [Tarenaya hassleriana]|uniref:cyclin-J18-like isoform X2 n=1 Tax=Tarenaya hassleriana TaxID=28532 RepID=UPI00053C38B3|nr:PREDICTED: cyclin-J18-like isoform X2 [Tarenaya hassleriana]
MNDKILPTGLLQMLLQTSKLNGSMDVMDLLNEKEATSILYGSSTTLAASILVCFYIVVVSKKRRKFPALPWVKFLTACKEDELLVLVRHILGQVQ